MKKNLHKWTMLFLFLILVLLTGCVNKNTNTDSTTASNEITDVEDTTESPAETPSAEVKEEDATAPETDLEKVKIGYSQLRISLPIFVADQMGYFKENGLDVELEMYDTAQPLMDALCGGKLDVAGYTAFQITMTASQASGTDLYYSTALMEDNDHPISVFIAKPDSGIHTIADFKNKKIGILPTLAYRAWVEMILKENGILDDVVIENVAPAMQGSALESGTVDILFTNDPAATTIVQSGIGQLLFDGAIVTDYTWSPYPFASFNMTKEFVDNNTDIAKKIVKSLDEAITYIQANQDDAKKMMANYLPDGQKQYVESYADALFIPSTEFTSKDLEKVATSYYEQGSITESIDLQNRAYPYTE